MQIMLAKDVEAFVAEQAKAGASPNATDLVNDALRAWSLHGPSPFELDEELESWLLKAADAPTTPLAREDFAEIRARVRTRLSEKAS
ncbi:MAG: hypothetical protein EXS37_19285 [Opitutus sp.]|nr:hypothetical protein [Opitutus sp.]